MRRRPPRNRYFELERLIVELGCIARTRGARLVVHDDIDSTNDEAKRLILAGERGPLWIVARRQSQGRGRLGRSWESPPGNLHASLILSDVGPARNAPQLGFVAGLATIEALRAATALSNRLALKWPNDVLLDGAKLAGVLLEAVAPPVVGSTELIAIIGVGVNCAATPSGLSYPAASLPPHGPNAASAATIFSHLTDAMFGSLDLWACGSGFEAVRAQWLSHAASLGRTIRVALAQETIEGRFETIDATGRLKLATERGERLIEAGDVFLLPNEASSNDRVLASERMDQGT
jgi:BirA family biotin operon repressor/biotin-[acetyl-CoA-carboxylase] ligase